MNDYFMPHKPPELERYMNNWNMLFLYSFQSLNTLDFYGINTNLETNVDCFSSIYQQFSPFLYALQNISKHQRAKEI